MITDPSMYPSQSNAVFILPMKHLISNVTITHSNLSAIYYPCLYKFLLYVAYLVANTKKFEF